MAAPISIPLINPNEPEALLAEFYAAPGQKLSVDDPICALETTKSTIDLLAETEGYLVGLQFAEGDTLRAGDVLGYIAESPEWEPRDDRQAVDSSQVETEVPNNLRITRPGLTLAREHNLDLRVLPLDILVTESTIRSFLEDPSNLGGPLTVGDYDPTAIVIYGCGGHGKSVLDLLRALRVYRIAGFIDDGVPAGEIIMGLPVLGGKDALLGLKDQGINQAVNAVGGIGNLQIRHQVFRVLREAGYRFPAVAHPGAIIEPSARISSGVQVFPLAYVGSEVQVGFGTIINTGAIVSHECILGDLVNISPGAILAGAVTVGDGALIGMGATVNLQATIGKGARVGNGATVKTDVPPNGIVPAGTIWPKGR
jgi:sugar O-acyltransferase (sialic acid O-acetyltransferase NeuD family)